MIMGNNTHCKIVGGDTVKIRMLDDVIRTLLDVMHVPKSKRNLITSTTSDSKDHKYTGECEVLKVS